MSVKPGVILKKEQFLHFRLAKNGHLLARGGATVCYSPEGDKAKVSLSLCSLKDHFCKRTGRNISRGRLPEADLPLMTFDELVKMGYDLAAQGWQELGKPAEFRHDVEVVLP